MIHSDQVARYYELHPKLICYPQKINLKDKFHNRYFGSFRAYLIHGSGKLEREGWFVFWRFIPTTHGCITHILCCMYLESLSINKIIYNLYISFQKCGGIPFRRHEQISEPFPKSKTKHCNVCEENLENTKSVTYTDIAAWTCRQSQTATLRCEWPYLF